MARSFPDQKDYSHELDVQRGRLDKIARDLQQQSEASAEIKEARAQKYEEYLKTEQDIKARQAQWKASINQKRAELKKMHAEPPVPEPSMFLVTEEMEQLDKPNIQRTDFIVQNVFERYLIDPQKFLANMKSLTEQKKINDEVVEKLNQRRASILAMLTGLKSQMAETQNSVQPFQHTGVLDDSVVAKKVNLQELQRKAQALRADLNNYYMTVSSLYDKLQLFKPESTEIECEDAEALKSLLDSPVGISLLPQDLPLYRCIELICTAIEQKLETADQLTLKLMRGLTRVQTIPLTQQCDLVDDLNLDSSDDDMALC